MVDEAQLKREGSGPLGDSCMPALPATPAATTALDGGIKGSS